MKKFLNSILLSLIFIKVIAFPLPAIIAKEGIANIPLLNTTVALGDNIYKTCILTPPVDPDQQAKCAAEYATYVANLQILHFDLTGKHTLLGAPTSDPYILSPYDVCRFDISNLILFNICGG